MADKTEIQERLEFWREALRELRKAYLSLLDGGAKSYKLGTQELTKLDLSSLAKRIEEAEKRVDELEAMAGGGRVRRAFTVIPVE